MSLRGKFHSRTAWWALCALVFSVLYPALPGWLAASGNSATTWVELCSATGVTRVAVDLGTPQPPSNAATAKHCTYCQLLTHLPVIPGAAAAMLFHTSGNRQPPAALSWRSAAAHFVRRAHHPRAPPVSC